MGCQFNAQRAYQRRHLFAAHKSAPASGMVRFDLLHRAKDGALVTF
jgi:hypothetical protein